MRIIQPFDLSIYKIEDLIKDKKIIDATDNKAWHSSIFPNSMKDALNNYTKLSYSKDNIITFIEDQIYIDYGIIILQKPEQEIYIRRGQGKKIIKCKEIGDYNNSVKRYSVLNLPLDYVKDNKASVFLNIPKQISSELDIIQPNLQFNPGNIFEPITSRSPEEKLFGKNINHPHVTTPKSVGVTKHNNKPILDSIFKWIVNQGIKYVYAINEWRPNVINDNYVTNLVYYTVTGSK